MLCVVSSGAVKSISSDTLVLRAGRGVRGPTILVEPVHRGPLTSRTARHAPRRSSRHHLARLLDCYVVATDVLNQNMSAQEVHDSYVRLQKVERDFRAMKTGLLEVPPIYYSEH
jgi:hypothetical protein